MKKQFLLLLLCLCCATAQAQWQPALSPATYALNGAIFKGDTAVVSAFEPLTKFYLTTDAGQKWADISDPAFSSFYPAKVNRGKVFAFSTAEGAAVYEGGKWQLRNKGLQTYPGQGYAMWSFDANDNQLLASNIKNNLNWLYLSNDDGLNWSPVSGSGLSAGYNAIYGAFAGKRIYSWGINAGSKPQAYYSDNTGQTWKSLPVSGPNGQTDVLNFNENRSVVLVKGAGGYYLHQGDSLVLADGLPAGGYISLVATSGNRMFLRRDEAMWASSDAGRHWSAAPQLPDFYDLKRYGSQWVGVTNQNKFFASSDNGDTWAPFGTTNVTTPFVGGLYSTGGQLFYVTIGKEGFYRYDPAAKDWEGRNTGIQKASSYFMQMLADGPKVLTNSWNGSFLSQDGGQTWQELPVLTWNVEKIGARYFAQNNELITSENGVDWSPLAAQPSDVSSIFGRDGKLYVSTYTGLLLASADVGASWDTISTALPAAPLRVAFDAAQWYFSADDGIYASSDEGKNWSQVGTFAQPYALLEHKGRLLTGLYGGGVRYTDDGGQNWKAGTTVATVKFQPDGNGLLAVGDALLATGSGGQVRVSVNQGASWTSFNTGLPNSVNCTETVVLGNWLYSPCDNGLWRRPLSEVPTVSATAEPIDNLYSASPNPTAGLFFLKNVPSGTKLRVQVSDLNGQTVFSGEISGNGYALDLTAQPPGMYCVKAFDGERWSVSRVVKQ